MGNGSDELNAAYDKLEDADRFRRDVIQSFIRDLREVLRRAEEAHDDALCAEVHAALAWARARLAQVEQRQGS
jgi:hypothetical protein